MSALEETVTDNRIGVLNHIFTSFKELARDDSYTAILEITELTSTCTSSLPNVSMTSIDP